MIVVQGRTLAGMAAAARLARLGHTVTIVGDDAPRVPLDHIELPAAWRDLFKKSGQPMAGALNSVHAQLVPAPPVTYLLPDGTTLTLPDDRAGQFTAIRDAFGERQAAQWRDLLDDLDDVWLALRRFGVEAPNRPDSPEARASLWLDRTLADVADRAGRLAPVILAEGPFAGTDSPRAPGLLAVRQVIVRTFGRHRLVGDDGATMPASTLVELLSRRLDERGVRREAGEAEGRHVLNTRAEISRRRLFSRPRPALAPHRAETEPGVAADIVDVTGGAPVRTIRGEHHATVLDHSRSTPDIAAGLAPDDAKRWLLRPAPSAHKASAACLAGGSDWGELLSAALAVYDLHEELTGDDCRPTNRAFTMPRLHSD